MRHHSIIKLAAVATALLACMAAYAQKTVTVSGSYAFPIPEDMTLRQAKAQALEQLKIQLIAEQFGTLVDAVNLLSVSDDKERLHTLGKSQVKGEWIETIGEPKYTVESRQGMQVVVVSAKGRIREIVSVQIDIEVKTLCNGTQDRFETDHFKEGDHFFLTFESPVKGFLTAYLYDGMDTVQCLLPYHFSDEGSVSIVAGRRYVFFERESPLEMTCSGTQEINRLYVIFSPANFTKARDDAAGGRLPHQLSMSEFQKWLTRARRQDKQLNVVTRDLVVDKQ